MSQKPALNVIPCPYAAGAIHTIHKTQRLTHKFLPKKWVYVLQEKHGDAATNLLWRMLSVKEGGYCYSGWAVRNLAQNKQ